MVFAPLLLVELTTLWLLALSPMVRVSRGTLYSLALMLVMFAIGDCSDSDNRRLRSRSRSMWCPSLVAFATALSLFALTGLPVAERSGSPATA